MNNFYLILIVALTLSTSLFAQKPGISIGGNVYFPVGDWAELANIGYGGSVTYEHPLGKGIAGVIYSGYTYFGGDTENFNWTMVPLLAGAKFYFTPKCQRKDKNCNCQVRDKLCSQGTQRKC